jgi:hypothetical protein
VRLAFSRAALAGSGRGAGSLIAVTSLLASSAVAVRRARRRVEP